MTEEKQRIAIAEYCGWKFRPSVDINGKAEPEYWIDPNGEVYWDILPIPNYPNDLNAMHEAEKTLDSMPYSFKITYLKELEKILEVELLKNNVDCIPDCLGYEQVHASSQQRAEAFLRTIGKWEGE